MSPGIVIMQILFRQWYYWYFICTVFPAMSKRYYFIALGVAGHTFNPTFNPSTQGEFQDSQGNIERPYLETKLKQPRKKDTIS